MSVSLRVMLAVAVGLGAACSDPHQGAGPLQAEMVKLERELEGLRESAARLERGEPVFPPTDVLITINESFVQGLVAAQLPIVVNSAPYQVTLTAVEVGFSGAPTVTLRGTITRDGLLTLDAVVGLIGALSRIEIDARTSTLRAQITADHFEIEEASGIETLLSGASLEDVAALVRGSSPGCAPRPPSWPSSSLRWCRIARGRDAAPRPNCRRSWSHCAQNATV